MFERNKGSYGLDDDPFLTRPAGPGSAYGAQSARVYQPQAPAQQRFDDQNAPPQRNQLRAERPVPVQGYGQAGASYSQPANSDGRAYNAQAYGADPYDQRGAEADYRETYHAQRTFAPYDGAAQSQAGHYAQGSGPEHSAAHASRRANVPVQPQTAQPQTAQPQTAQGPSQRTRAYAPLPHVGPDYRPSDYGTPDYGTPDYDAPKFGGQEYGGPQYGGPQYGGPEYGPQNYGAAPKFGAPRSGIVQWAGALCTVAVLIGAGYWGYALAVRDASGIPVVRAAMGPLRIAPETPGGEVSPHQGLAVNAIPAAGLGQELPQEITLAPQSDMLSAADTITESGSFAQIGGQNGAEIVLGASDAVVSTPQIGSSGVADLTALPDALPDDMPLSDEDAVVRALEMALAEGGDFDAIDPAAPLEPVGMSAASPASLAPDMTPVLPPTAEVDPATIAAGTAMVQLGAFDDEALARAEWANLQTRFTELVAQKALVVQQAQSGGRNFYRLRAHGFSGPDETRRFCAAILAENGTCLPVVQR